MRPLLFSEQYRIRISEVNAQHQLTVPALVNLLHEVAWQHSVQLGVSVPDLLPRGISWVLSRMRLEVSNLPHLAETVSLESWIQANDRYFSHRDFEMRDSQGSLLVKATSVWGVLDMERRRIVPIPDWIAKDAVLNTERVGMEPALGKMPSVDVASYQQHFGVRWHDIDANAHVNNTCYFAWLVEALPAEFLSANRLRYLDIIFRAESTLQDGILAQAAPGPHDQPLSFLHNILNAEGRELVQARSEWVPL